MYLKDTLRLCRPGDDGCLSYLHWASPIWFTSFVVMGQFMLVNLVVATIMQALEESNEVRQNAQSKKVHRHKASLWLEQLLILFDHMVLITGKTHCLYFCIIVTEKLLVHIRSAEHERVKQFDIY